MNEQYAEKIVRFPIFRGFTLAGAGMLLDRGEVNGLLRLYDIALTLPPSKIRFILCLHDSSNHPGE